MKTLFIGSTLTFVFAHACFGQGKVEGYVEVDGKPFRNANVMVYALTGHLANGDWWFPIITPRVVGVIGETGTPTYEASDWYTIKKTDKSGHFRVAIPARMTGIKIGVRVYAGSLTKDYSHPEKRQWFKLPCADRTIAVQAGAVQNDRYNLNSARTMDQGGCLQLSGDR